MDFGMRKWRHSISWGKETLGRNLGIVAENTEQWGQMGGQKPGADGSYLLFSEA